MDRHLKNQNTSNNITTITTIEDKLKQHYHRKKEYERLEHSLNRALRHREEIQRDIDTSNISFGVSVSGVSYGRDRVQAHDTASPQEREIDKAFAKLEQALERVNHEILETKSRMRELEAVIADVEFVVNDLEQEAQVFVDLRYRHFKSNPFIARRLHLSESAIRRLKKRTMNELAKRFA